MSSVTSAQKNCKRKKITKKDEEVVGLMSHHTSHLEEAKHFKEPRPVDPMFISDQSMYKGNCSKRDMITSALQSL